MPSPRRKAHYLNRVDPNLNPDDLSAFVAAKDIPELVAMTKTIGSGLWTLLRPTNVGRQVLLSPRGRLTVDPLPGSQIANINYPLSSIAAPSSSSWGSRLLSLLSFQEDLAGHTKVMLPVWEEGTLVAVAGTANASHLLVPAALAIRRLHQVGQAQRDVEGAKYLLSRADKGIVLAAQCGEVVLGTAAGFAVLEQLQIANRLTILPPSLRSAIKLETRQVTLEGIQVNLSCLPLPEPTTVSPLVSVRFSRKKHGARRQVDLATALRELTPTEQKVYPYLVTGLRTKEIADRVSCSFHTARHHISSILKKCGCDDRLLLMTKARQLPSVTSTTNPTVPPLPAVKDVPLPAPRRRPSEIF